MMTAQTKPALLPPSRGKMVLVIALGGWQISGHLLQQDSRSIRLRVCGCVHCMSVLSCPCPPSTPPLVPGLEANASRDWALTLRSTFNLRCNSYAEPLMMVVVVVVGEEG